MIFFVVGAPESGKSHFVKEYIAQSGAPPEKVMALDVNHEYPQAGQKFYNHDDLVEAALERVNNDPKQQVKSRGNIIVFEEATSFFGSRNTKRAKELFTTNRHNHHTIFANFHSLATIPSDLIITMNYLYYTETVEKKSNLDDMFKGIDRYSLYSKKDLIFTMYDQEGESEEKENENEREKMERDDNRGAKRLLDGLK